MVTIGVTVKRFNRFIFCMLIFLCFSAVSYASQKDVPAESEKTAGITKVNINTASAEKLATLPGVGPALAERIIRHRKDVGKFKAPGELIAVKGVGQKKLDRIIQFIVVK